MAKNEKDEIPNMGHVGKGESHQNQISLIDFNLWYRGSLRGTDESPQALDISTRKGKWSDALFTTSGDLITSLLIKREAYAFGVKT